MMLNWKVLHRTWHEENFFGDFQQVRRLRMLVESQIRRAIPVVNLVDHYREKVVDYL